MITKIVNRLLEHEECSSVVIASTSEGFRCVLSFFNEMMGDDGQSDEVSGFGATMKSALNDAINKYQTIRPNLPPKKRRDDASR